MTIKLENQYIKTNGITLHTVQAGPEDGPLVILLHGFPEFWYGWSHQIPDLVDAGYRLVVPDQRGYNLSDKPAGLTAYNLDDLTADVVGLIDALGRDQVLLVGHDWGAAVAWHTARKYPKRVHKLGILNVPHPDVMLKFMFGSLEQMRKSWYIFFFQLPWFPEMLLRANAYNAMLRMLNGNRPESFNGEDYEQYRKAWSQPGALTSMINWYRAMMRAKPKPIVDQRISVPTLMIWGKQDIALSHHMAQPSVDLCNDGRLVMIDEATHWVQHDEPERVNALLLEFFNS